MEKLKPHIRQYQSIILKTTATDATKIPLAKYPNDPYARTNFRISNIDNQLLAQVYPDTVVLDLWSPSLALSVTDNMVDAVHFQKGMYKFAHDLLLHAVHLILV